MNPTQLAQQQKQFEQNKAAAYKLLCGIKSHLTSTQVSSIVVSEKLTPKSNL